MQNIVELLERHEGLRLKPYKDSVGKLTIGIGRNLDDVGITKEEAHILLLNDIATAKIEIEKNFSSWFPYLGAYRKMVIISMVFNLGMPRFKGFKKFIAAIENKDFETASKEMLDSRWAKQVGNRALELSDMMKKGME